MTPACAEFVAEIDAFYQGFGQPEALTASMRAAALIVPLTSDNRVWTSDVRGIGWITAFTSEHELAKHALARGETGEARYHTVFGWRILDEVAASFGRPTGVVVDPSGDRPMAFPPDVEEE